jgi:hypothetical protein
MKGPRWSAVRQGWAVVGWPVQSGGSTVREGFGEMRFAWAILGAGLPLLQAATAHPADEPVDIALVLLADVSQSVDAARYTMQKEGYRAAFRDPDVVAAILSGGEGRIAVTLRRVRRGRAGANRGGLDGD